MKKLLVLMLVLGIASAASAVSLTLSQPDTALPVVSVGGDLDQDLYIVLVSDGTLSNFALGPDAPDLSGYAGPASDVAGFYPASSPAGKAYTSGEYWVMATTDLVVYPIIGGVYLSAEFAFEDCVYALWFDEVNFTPNVIGELFIIPEPVTIALLGLGGLFLLRRRK